MRFGIAASALFAAITTAASCGAVNAMHDSFTPLGGLVPLVNMQLGEVVFGGVGSGPVRHARLRDPGGVHRRPDDRPHARIPGQEDRGVRDEDDARSRSSSRRCWCWSARRSRCMTDAGKAGIANPGAHGFSEILYAFTSAANNNGSAFAGVSANTPFYNVLLAHRDVVRPLRADRAGAGDRRLAGRQEEASPDGRHAAHARAAVRRAAGRHGAAGGRCSTYVPALALGRSSSTCMLWNDETHHDSHDHPVRAWLRSRRLLIGRALAQAVRASSIRASSGATR